MKGPYKVLGLLHIKLKITKKFVLKNYEIFFRYLFNI